MIEVLICNDSKSYVKGTTTNSDEYQGCVSEGVVQFEVD